MPAPAAAPAPAPAPAAAPEPAAPSALAPPAAAAGPAEAAPAQPQPQAQAAHDDAQAAGEPRDGAHPPEAAVALADPPAPAPEPAISVPAPEDLDGMAAIWPAVRDAVCAENQMVGIAISDARPVELRENELVVAFAREDRFNQRQAALPEHRAIVEDAVRGLAGRALRVSFELRDLDPENAEAVAETALGGRDRRALRDRVRCPGDRPRPRRREGRRGLMPQPPNMQQMMRQVQKMQQDMLEAQEALKHEEVEASAGGGMVKVKVSGDLIVKSIVIAPEAIDPDDPDLLQDMVLAAVNEGMRAAQELQQSKLGGLTGGMDLGSLGLGL